jgi:DNA-binding NarL/FixJ family response regulator
MPQKPRLCRRGRTKVSRVRIHGRGPEQARVHEVLEAARAGTGGVLVVHGEPGVGKSTLLADLARAAAGGTGEDAASGIQVLRTQGIESEAPLPFAALQRLLRPVMGAADQIPAPQAHALRVAFGEELPPAPTGAVDRKSPSGDGHGERFLVFLGTLNLLAAAGSERPVLAIVDDAHWLDPASAAALLFAARRLSLEPVAIVFGARDGDVRAFDAGDLPALELGGLDRVAVQALLSDRAAAPVSAEVSAQLLAATGGNPLALVELPEVLSAPQLQGRAPLPGRMPVTGGVERVFAQRADRLSEDARRLLLIVAADDSTHVPVIRAAARSLGVDPDALDEVERSGLVTVTDDRVDLRHPLVRSAVYSGATSVSRRATHRALATALGPEEADRRAWHRAAGADEPDESVVAELVEAATRARHRGAHEVAASAYERGSELTGDPAARSRLLYQAARCAWLCGHPAHARTLADATLADVADPGLRADAARLRARIEWNTGSVQLGHRMVLQAAAEVAAVDPARAREMAMFAAALAVFGGDSGIDLDPIDFVADPGPEASARQRTFADLIVGLDHIRHGRWPEAGATLNSLFLTAGDLETDDQDLLPNLGIAALHVGDDAASHRFHGMLLARARDTGAMVMVLYSLTRLALVDLAAGHWSRAESRCAEAIELGEETGQPVLAATPRAIQLLIAARRGEVDTYQAALADVEAVTGAQSAGILDTIVRDLTRWAKGVHAAHAGEKPGAAFHHLAQISHDITRRMAGIDRIEAAAAAGQTAAARLWVEDLAGFAGATRQAWAHAAAEHGRAILAESSAEAEAAFVAALDAHAAAEEADAGRVFDRAHTRLAYGEHLRRHRRRVDARDQLRAALVTFEDLRAEPSARRAAAELRASGETARKRDSSEPARLTAQELTVASLVQEGMTNREIAGQLFLSPRTVDFHLRNVFTKTGVTSRVELARLDLGS